jgi:hypothetical protein
MEENAIYITSVIPCMISSSRYVRSTNDNGNIAPFRKEADSKNRFDILSPKATDGQA